MALRWRCSQSSCLRSQVYARSFSSTRTAEDESSTSSSRRIVQRASADAIQNLAKERSASSPASTLRIRRIDGPPSAVTRGSFAPRITDRLGKETSPSTGGSEGAFRIIREVSDFTPDAGRGGFSRRGSRGGFSGRGSRGGFSSRGSRGSYSRGRGGSSRGRSIRSDGEHDYEGENEKAPVVEDEDVQITAEQYKTYLGALADVDPSEAFQVTIDQGPQLDVAQMMKEYAPKHFGVTEPASGEYPALNDQKRKGLLQEIVKQARRNPSYSEANIDQMVKKLGPAMPRA